MSFSVPTLTALRDRIEADFNTRIKGADSRLRRGVLRALSFAWASVQWAAYQFLGWISRQRLPDTADDDQLDRIGGVYGLTRTGAATASGSATVTGVDGSAIPAGSTLQAGDGTVYAVSTVAKIVGETATLQLVAAAPGLAGNQTSGTQLSFIAPVAGVNVVATVAAIAGGLDLERDDDFRARLLDRMRSPPQGGAAGDYVQWAKELPGVRRAWEVADWVGPGTVGVLFVFDDRPDILPTDDDVAAMQALLERKRPITTAVYAAAPVAKPLDITAALNPASDLLWATVTAELQDLIGREGIPGGTIPLNHIKQAFGLAVGAGDYRLTAPAGDVAVGRGEITTLGTLTRAAWS